MEIETIDTIDYSRDHFEVWDDCLRERSFVWDGVCSFCQLSVPSDCPSYALTFPSGWHSPYQRGPGWCCWCCCGLRWGWWGWGGVNRYEHDSMLIWIQSGCSHGTPWNLLKLYCNFVEESFCFRDFSGGRLHARAWRGRRRWWWRWRWQDGWWQVQMWVQK